MNISDTVTEKMYSLLQFDLTSNKLQTYPLWWNPEYPPNLGSVTVLGIDVAVKQVTINNVSQTFKYDTINKVIKNHTIFFFCKLSLFLYSQYLLVEKLDLSFSETIELIWK